MNIDNYLRTPITIEQLSKFSQDELDMYSLYTKQDILDMDENTVIFLDEPIYVDDTDEEIYPEFSQKHNLQAYFSGQVASDIISNTNHQLKPQTPSLCDYIKNFNYYDEHDCFFTFS